MAETRFPGHALDIAMDQAIAVIGMGMRFPSNIKNESGMWEALMSGESGISEIPEDRWPTDVLRHPKRGEPGRSVSFAAGVLREAFLFDASFFNISPRETTWMDPQQRLLLEMTHEAMEDAGLTDKQYRGSECGVYIGISGMDYGQNALTDLSSMSAHTMTGNTLSIAANRISYAFDLHGPSLAIDTACSSSLAAVHEACQALNSGAIPLAVAGGINMLMHPYPFIGFSHAAMLSASGQCRPFDVSGDGYVRGEGGAVLVLKPLSAALADGDHIHAVIIGSGVNSDGAGKKGLTIPSANAQTELMERVLHKSGLSADDLSYVEAHGTGTPVGDPAEAESIGGAYGKFRSRPLPISSAKANFGHLEPASGMAGLIKVILALKHAQVPPMPFDFNPNPNIDFEKLNIYCAANGARLEAKDGMPLVGAVNSFGFGGLNAHVLLCQSPQIEPQKNPKTPKIVPPLVISAKSQASLAELADRYADLLEKEPEGDFYDLAWNAFFRRSLMEKRMALATDNADERVKALREFSKGKSAKQISAENALPKQGRIAFVYNGNGAQWYGMGRKLYQESPAFAKMLDLLDRKMEKVTGWSILKALFNAPEETFQDTAISQPLLFAIQVALTSLFEEMGVKPDATCGHSVGEIAAAWGAGALTLDEAIKIIHARSTAQEKTRGMGRMAVAGLGASQAMEEAERLDLSNGLEIAAANSPNNCTLSGDAEALLKLGKALEEKGVFFRVLDLDYAFHSRYMDRVKGFMEDMLEGLAPVSPQKAIFISTVKGGKLSSQDLGVEYWWENMRQPVRFDAGIQALVDLDINIFVEIGPHAILQRYMRENLPQDLQARVLPSLQQSSDGIERIRSTASTIYLLAPESTLPSLFSVKAPWKSLPTYAWEHQRFAFPSTVERTPLPAKSKPLLGWPLLGANPSWEIILDPLKDTWLVDHQVGRSVVFPAAAYVEMALEAAAQWQGKSDIILENFDILLPLLFENNKAQTLRCEINSDDGSFIIQSRSRMENGPWLTHAKGRIIFQKPKSVKPASSSLLNIGKRISHEDIYLITRRLGLDYGPFFSRIDSLFTKGKEIEAILEDYRDTDGYIVNPGAMDACFHSLAAIYATGEGDEAYLPVGFKELKIFSSHPVKFIRAAITRRAKRTIHANFELLDVQNKLVARFSDCRFRKLPSVAKSLSIDTWHYHKLQKALPSPAETVGGNLGQIASSLFRDYEHDAGRKLWYQEILPRLEASVIAFIISGKNNYNFNNIPLVLKDWMEELYLSVENAGEIPDWKEIWREAHNLSPRFFPALLPLGRVMDGLLKIMKGRTTLEDLLLEPNSIAQENSAFNPAFTGIDAVLDNFINELIKPGRNVDLLEAGSYSKLIDQRLAAKVESGNVSRTFIMAENSSPHNPHGGEDSLTEYDFLKSFEKRDKNKLYDIVVLRQILHKVQDLKGALQDVHSSLAPGGVLLITERYPDWSADLTSGLSESWWREGEERKLLSSRMKPESWLALLESGGFEESGIIREPEAGGLAEGAYLIYGRKRSSNPSEDSIPASTANWVLLHDAQSQKLAESLAEKLRVNGHDAEVLFKDREIPIGAENLIILYGEKQEVEKTPELLSELNSMILKVAPAGKTWIVTRGAYSLDDQNEPVQAAIAGLTRVFNSEKSELKARLRDLSPDLNPEEAATALMKEIAADSVEDEICLSREGRYICSLNKGQAPDSQNIERIKLDIPQPGRLDNLIWQEDEKGVLGEGEVEARVMATGLNFRDIMLAMGLLPEDALENGFAGPNLGLEFSGVVTAIGENVTNFAVGDKVAGFASASFASHVRTPANSLTHIPNNMDFAAAAAAPTIFITAWYALKHLANLQKGERLLIHGGAGGVGLAAIQIGRLLGAEIFATAGTREKRDYLRLLGVDHVLDSRSLNFAEDILDLTEGQGVDVALNSLAGEAMRRSVSLLKPFGRFLELGKRDYVENTSIGLRPFKENISYFSIDVDQLQTARPDLAKTLFEEVMTHLRNGRLTSPPIKIFEASQVEEAFRTMQQARHMGKVVVDMSELPPINVKGKGEYKSTWLISGGASGFGLETARHLAEKGAKTLVLASRRGENISEAESIKEEFAALGTNVVLKSCDFSKKENVFELVNWIERNLPPLEGVVHAAAVFDDRKLEDLDQASFTRSINPKMLGALYLHEATRSIPLKYFILYSSISVAIGNPGQGNYVAANSALEALTRARNSHNLPASCLAWGPIGDSGYLSRNEAVQKNLAMQLGRPPLTSKQAMAAFDLFVGHNGVHILANINWHRALEFSDHIPARLEEVYKLCEVENEGDVNTDFTSSLTRLNESEALDRLKKVISLETAKVLGMDASLTPHDRSLQAMGLDSLMAMELALSLEQTTGLRLPPMLLQDAPTIEQLAVRLWERLEKREKAEKPEEVMLGELARRHSEELKPEEIKDLLKNIESANT